MASLTLAVEDSSALIRYEPADAWVNPLPAQDQLLQSYSGLSFHATRTQGATATIQFDGTGINIFSGTRPDYGSFQLKIDGNVVAQGSLVSAQPEFNKMIASATGLTNGPHTAVLENTSAAPMDLDMVEIITQFGSPGSQLQSTDYDDEHPGFTYAPNPAAWRVNRAEGFMGNTLHFTNAPDAAATVSWEGGDGFAFWSTAAPDHRDIILELDGQQVTTLAGGNNGKTSGLRPNTLMYYQNSLAPGPHTLKISGGEGGPFLDVDAIRVFTTTGGDPGQVATSGATSNSAISTGAIAGIVAGAVALLLLIGLLIFFLRRRGGIGLGRQRRDTPSDVPTQRSFNKSLKSLDIETGRRGLPISEKMGSYPVPPLSTTSSFFALERASHFPAPKTAHVHNGSIDYVGSINSTTPMVPPLPPGVGTTRSESRQSFGPTEGFNLVETASSDVDAYLTSNRSARDYHQSVAAEVVYADYGKAM